METYQKVKNGDCCRETGKKVDLEGFIQFFVIF